MAFTFNRREVERNTLSVTKPIGLATVKGSIYVNSLTTGALELASASTSTSKVYFVANETIAAGVSTTVSCNILEQGDFMIADLVNNSNAVHNGQRMTMSATANTLTNSGTDAAAGQFEQFSVIGAAADKKALVIRI